MIGNTFAGMGALMWFILRRDRARLLIWIVVLGGFVVGFVPVFENIIITDTDSTVMAEMMKNPAMIAIVGPVYGADNYSVGASYANMMLLFSVLIAGVMNIFLIIRHTRQDEEMGRLEVIRSLPVGRLSNLASAMAVSLIVNTALALLSGLGMYIVCAEGMDFSGSMIFGAAMGVIGLFFAAATALFCQMTANSRTASGFSFALLLMLYMLRAMGDVGMETLSLISPLGLILRTENFVNDYWWPVWVVLAISVVIAIAAFGLAGIRDLGRGLVPEKPGRRHASKLLSSPLGLALRLLKTSIIVWTVTIFALAAMYGSVFGDLESFISTNDMLQAIFAGGNGFSLTQQFIVLLMAIMSMIATIPVLSFMQRAEGEEKQGHSEHLFARAVSRSEQFFAYFIIAFCMSVILQLLSALGFWSVGSMVLDTIPSLGTFIQASFAYLPAIWVMMGVSAALIACLPDNTSISYIYLGFSMFVIYIGRIAGLPDWTQKITPFGYIPQIPVEEMKTVNLIVLTVVAAALTVFGFVGYGKRDMKTQ